MSQRLPIPSRRALLWILLLAIAARGGLMAWKSSELTQDRDAYLGIAASVAEGRGFSSPGSDSPTAFRPPLYPLLLATAIRFQPALWVAAINLLSGVATVWLTYRIGLRLGLSGAGLLLGTGLVAIDPLLVRYSTQAMSESLCTLLVTAWLWVTLPLLASPSRWEGLLAGLVFGLATLCRPTMWVAGGAVALFLLWTWRENRRCGGRKAIEPIADQAGSVIRSPLSWIDSLQTSGWGLVGTALIVTPWVVRNQLVMGAPILTTTHGGYTLLLGNNAAFYTAVAEQPWGTAWDGSQGPSQAEWMESIQFELRQAGVRGEIEQDAWMQQRARAEISARPGSFVSSAILRIAWFWSPVPHAEASVGWPRVAIGGVGLFYALEWLAGLAGLWTVIRRRAELWVPGILIVASFCVVHVWYWSNARMRAPVMPIVALMAAQGAVILGTVLANTFRPLHGANSR